MKKNNLEYLIKREKEYQEYLKKTDQAYDEKLIRLYNQAMDRIAREIERQYANYAKGEGITIDEAMDKVSRFEAEEFEEKAKKYVKELDFSERANYELKLYNLKIRTSRLELMKREMLLETIALADKESKMLEKRLGEIVREEINRQSAILGLSKEVRLRLIKIAAVIVASNFHGANFSDRIWANREELQKQLEIGLTRTILQGENHMLWTKKLENLMTDNGKQNALYNAKRIASTEVSRAFSEASLAAYKESGFKKYIWIAEQDSRTCSICNALDGEVFDVDRSIIGSDTPPVHPFCRCTTAAYEERNMDEDKELGYNIDIPEELKDFNLDMDIGKQKNHIYGTNEFKQRIKNGIEPSHFKNSIDEVENSLRPLIGSGTIKGTKEGTLKEIIEVNDLRSFVLNNNENKLYKTNAITLRYNKTKGWHAYPDYPSKLRGNKNENNKNK
ncbi:minor capsid protein [Lagierella massiliensis]|uniref:minor capsid protein n=1 Tax=Lagierella massiliensis TaxID=1689303 RepID=UPI0006D8377F|nr:minor capsid protein [Lagierella massiliensis]